MEDLTSLIFNMTDKQKLLLDEFMVENRDFLLTCAKNILNSKKEKAEDLLHDLFIYLYENFTTISYIKDKTTLLAFSISWIRLQVKWNKTAFKKLYEVQYEELPVNLPLEEDFTIILHGEDPYVKELKRIYNDTQVDRLVKVWKYIPKLSKVNQILFQAYFIEGLSYDKIKEQYTFFREKDGRVQLYKSKKSIYNLMKELKKELLLCMS